MPPDRYVTQPCPSEACRGLSRVFEVHVHRPDAGGRVDEVAICTVCGFNPDRVSVAEPDNG